MCKEFLPTFISWRQDAGMAGKKLELDVTGRTVAENIGRVRRERGLNYTELSKALMAIGRDITALAVRRIEEAQRRVDTDDLMAIAAALNTAPASLLMPRTGAGEDLVQTTAMSEPAPAERVWGWVSGEYPIIRYRDMSDDDQWVEFAHESWPIWRVREMYNKLFEEVIEEARREGREDRSSKLQQIMENQIGLMENEIRGNDGDD